MTEGPDWGNFSWRTPQLPRALNELARAAGLSREVIELPSPSKGDEGSWIEWVATHLRCEAEPIDIPLRDLETQLAEASPALLCIGESQYLAVLKSNPHRLLVLTPNLKRCYISTAELSVFIRANFSAPPNKQLENLLFRSRLSSSAIQKAVPLLVGEKSGDKPCHLGWILLRDSGGDSLPLLRNLGVIRCGGGLLAAHLIQYLLLIASWALLGHFSLAGRVERPWLIAWALLLFTMLPFQVLGTWLQGLFSIGFGAFLKRRLLCGALKLHPEEVRHAGAGTFLGQALEAEAVERLALSGGLPGLLATIELLLSMLLLGKLALLLALVLGLAVYCAVRFLRRYQRWTETRLKLTNELVESMAGHRTRLAQQSPAEWHEAEDLSLYRYLLHSQVLDRAGATLIAALPRCWIVLALAGLTPEIMAPPSSVQLPIELGGVLLAYSALRKWTNAFAGVAAAWAAWQRIAPLLQAASRREPPGQILTQSTSASRFDKILEAERVTFRYRPNAKPAVRECSLTVRHGSRILLEGSSGGGKTTFASLLSGIRQPESGLLLVDGLDRQSMGSKHWCKVVAAAPQFHENYLLTESLAFNLLMGRRWPPTESDLEEAESVCRELGLGNLLDTMPSGLLQMIGEGGWQLSHGERSRVFLARALLQNARLVILDESFATLDPENAKLALEYAIERANALIVIAHP